MCEFNLKKKLNFEHESHAVSPKYHRSSHHYYCVFCINYIFLYALYRIARDERRFLWSYACVSLLLRGGSTKARTNNCPLLSSLGSGVQLNNKKPFSKRDKHRMINHTGQTQRDRLMLSNANITLVTILDKYINNIFIYSKDETHDSFAHRTDPFDSIRHDNDGW